jgi:hypothetical protein
VTRPYSNRPYPHCRKGHPLYGTNVYRKSHKRFCRTCRTAESAKQRIRLKAEDQALIEREIRWLHDLPAICDEADRLATSPGHL